MLPLVTGLASRPRSAERVADEQRDLAALVQPGRLARVEVDDQPVGVARPAVAADRPLVHVQLQRGQVDQPGQRRQVVDDREGDVAVRPCRRGEPVVGTVAVRTQDGVPAGAFFSKKLMSSTPCGQRIRVTAPVLEVRQHHRRDLRVVVEHLALGGPGARVEHLGEVADLEGPALDVDEDLLLLGLLLRQLIAPPRSPGRARVEPRISCRRNGRGALTQPAVAPGPLTCRKIPEPRCRTWRGLKSMTTDSWYCCRKSMQPLGAVRVAARQPPAEAALALVAVAVVERRRVVLHPVVTASDLAGSAAPARRAPAGCRTPTAARRCRAAWCRCPACAAVRRTRPP